MFLVVSPFVHGQISFAPYQIITTGSWAEVVAIDDVNDDGLNDVVLGTTFNGDAANDYRIFIYLQDTSGNLLPPLKLHYGTININSIVINDVNNDNRNDIIIGFGKNIGIYFQHSTGGFSSIQVYQLNNANNYPVNGLSTGDLNSDGLEDIAVSYSSNDFIKVMYQQYSGGFQISRYSAPYDQNNEVEIADVNNDNKKDLIYLGCYFNRGTYIFRQTVLGLDSTYEAHIDTPFTFGYNVGLAIGDLNNDGLNDIVKTNDANSPNSKFIINFHHSSISDSLLPPMDFITYDSPEPVRIADLNCDGKNELITTHGGFNYISVTEQNPITYFNTYSLFFIDAATHYNTKGISIGDINGDQKKDIVLANGDLGLQILYNTSSLSSVCCAQPSFSPCPIGNTIICQNDTVKYFSDSLTSNNTTWNLLPSQAGNFIFTCNDSCVIAWNQSWTGTAALFTKTTNDCGIAISDTLFIEINHRPSLSLGPDEQLCSGDSLFISVNSHYNTSYSWQDNSTDSLFIATMGGTYSLLASNACGTDTDTIIITEIPNPSISLPTDTFICDQNPIIIDASVPSNASYIWSNGSSNSFTEIALPGEYSVSVTDSNGCKSCDTVSITELNSPYSDIIDTYTICAGTELTLNAFNYGSTYVWQDGSTDAQFTAQDSGLYYVTVSNFCGTVSDSTIIKVSDCTDYLELPSAFSPNNDGINDLLIPTGRNITNIRLMIYDRWGEKVFECNCGLPQNPVISECAWNGTFRGSDLEPGVYMYYLSGNSVLDGRIIQHSGNITLVR